MKIILIMALIGAVLYAIDMLVCKISPKAGYMVAIFNLPFLPVGIVTFILTQKYLEKTLGVSDVTQYFRESGESAKQKKKKGKSSANISQKTAEVQANKRIELVIPEGTTEINDREFENREDIISVVIPKGVNRIRKQAFAGCKNLKKVSLPDDITISPDAFLYCNKLSDEVEQKIADKLEGMYRKSFVNSGFRYSTPNSDPNYDTTGEGLDTNKFIYETRRAQNGEFYTACFSRLGNPQGTHTDNHTSSTKKTPKTAPTAKKSVDKCSNTPVTEATPAKATKMEELIELVIPKGTTEIKDSEFKNRDDIISVVIPEGLTVIGRRDEPCMGSIVIPEGIRMIVSDAFKHCSNLESVHISNLEAWCNILFENELSNPLRHAKELYVNGELITRCEIPKEIKKISPNAFRGYKGLEELVIPEGVSEIGQATFCSCYNLKNVHIPTSIKTMEFKAFDMCTSLESVHIRNLYKWCSIDFDNASNPLKWAKGLYLNGKLVTKCEIPKGIKKIQPRIFYGYKGLEEVIIPEEVTEIGEQAFCQCKNLTSVTIPEGVTFIGKSAFGGCFRLKNVYINNFEKWYSIERKDSPVYYADNLYVNGEVLTKLSVPESISRIPEHFLQGYKGLEELIISGETEVIGKYAFECTNLKSLVINKGVKVIECGAFVGCENLTSVEIADSVEIIGERAFKDCVNLSSVTIPEGVTTIGNEAFYGCSNLIEITIPESVTFIGEYAFERCTNLKSLVINKGVKVIKCGAFVGCKNLTSVEIADSVEIIGESAFKNCVNLSSVKIPGSVIKIGEDAFEGCGAIDSETMRVIQNKTERTKVYSSVGNSGYPYDSPEDDPNFDPYYDPVYPSHPRVERETKSGQRYWARF